MGLAQRGSQVTARERAVLRTASHGKRRPCDRAPFAVRIRTVGGLLVEVRAALSPVSGGTNPASLAPMRFGLGGYRGLATVVLGLALSAACGGSVADDTSTGGVGGAGTGATGGSVHTGGTGGIIVTGGTGGKDAGPDAKPDAKTGGTGGYIDPGCPDAEPPPPVKDCDPFGPNTCSAGNACYPFVQYPSGPCEQEIFGAICAPVGPGKQGDPCGSTNCSAGFVCVVTGQGTECVQLCDLFGAAKCPPGLFCVPIDVEGIGGCY